MSQKNNDGGNKGRFVVDLVDENDGLDFPSDDEVDISEDQQIMEELIRKDREREEKLSRRNGQLTFLFKVRFCVQGN